MSTLGRKRLAAGAAITAALATMPFWLPGERAEPTNKLTPSERVVMRINGVRARHDLPPLRYSQRLSRASRRWSAKLYAERAFYHANLQLGPFSRIAEVISRGNRNPVSAWLKSPPHRAIILSPAYSLIGAGKYDGYWTARAARR